MVRAWGRWDKSVVLAIIILVRNKALDIHWYIYIYDTLSRMINASSELSLQAGTPCGGRWRVGWRTVWTGCFWRRFYTSVKPETGIKVNCPTSFCRRMYSTIAVQHYPSLDLCRQKTRGISNFRPLHARIIKTGVEIKLFSDNTLYYMLCTNAHTYEFIYFVLKCARVCVHACL